MNELLREYFGSADRHRQYDMRVGGAEHDEAFERFMKLGGDLVEDRASVITGGFIRKSQGASTVELELIRLVDDNDEYGDDEYDTADTDDNEGKEYELIGAAEPEPFSLAAAIETTDVVGAGDAEPSISARYAEVDEFIKHSGIFDN